MTVRRMKAYTGETGYVYQYYFVGKRTALPGAAPDPATEFIFDVTSDRKTLFSVSVFLSDSAVRAWGASHGRPLTDAEQYAAAKLRLFRAFDQIEQLMNEGRVLVVDGDTLEEVLGTLGVD